MRYVGFGGGGGGGFCCSVMAKEDYAVSGIIAAHTLQQPPFSKASSKSMGWVKAFAYKGVFFIIPVYNFALLDGNAYITYFDLM